MSEPRTPTQKLVTELAQHAANTPGIQKTDLLYIVALADDGAPVTMMLTKEPKNYTRDLFRSLTSMVRSLAERGLEKEDIFRAVKAAYNLQAELLLPDDAPLQ